VTAMVEALFEKFPERREEWPKQNMLGRLSRPEEYRGAAAFLLSDASSFMTGESSIPLFGAKKAGWERELMYLCRRLGFENGWRACCVVDGEQKVEAGGRGYKTG